MYKKKSHNYFCRYVDSGRCVSTELGGTNQDLKDKMASSGIRGISEFDRTRSGCTNEMMYLRQVMDHNKLSKLSRNIINIRVSFHIH